MFTGIVQVIGIVTRNEARGGDVRLAVDASALGVELALGDVFVARAEERFASDAEHWAEFAVVVDDENVFVVRQSAARDGLGVRGADTEALFDPLMDVGEGARVDDVARVGAVRRQHAAVAAGMHG